MAANEVAINIADINFNLSFEERPSLPKNLRKFIKKPSKDGCHYIISKDNLNYQTEIRPHDKIFQSEGWVLSKNINNKLQLAVYSNEILTRFAILTDDYLQGEIFLLTEHKNIRLYYAYDYPVDQILFSAVAGKHRAALFHSFGLALNKKRGLMFLGQSGAGKSTSAKLWAKFTNKLVLSDDRVAVRKGKNKFILHGTPWHGDANLYSNKSSPLEKIFFLKHGKKNEIKPINPTQAAALLVARSFPPYWDAEGMQNVLNLCTEIAQTIPCYEFSFVPDKSAVDFVLNLG